MSDAELLKLTAQRDDSEAFGVFYCRYQDMLTAFLVQRTRDADLAQDLVAESFAIAYSKAARFDPARGDGRRWLFGIARVAMLASARVGGVEEATRRRVGMAVRGYSDEAWELAEARLDSTTSDVVSGLDDLSDGERAAVIARVIQDRDYAEIARTQYATEQAIRQRVSRGLKKLGKVLGERHQP